MPPWQRTAQLDARAGEAIPRGKAGSERRKACFHPGGSGFHLPRGGGSAAFQFYQLGFYVARSLLWYFLGLQKSTVFLVPLIPLPPVLAAVLGNLLHFFMLGGQLRRAVGFRRQRLIALP